MGYRPASSENTFPLNMDLKDNSLLEHLILDKVEH